MTTKERLAPGARFNLVCHGMIGYWRTSDTEAAILIPDEGDQHAYRIGCVRPEPGAPPSVEYLDSLPAGRFRLQGLRAASMGAAEFRRQLDLPILKAQRYRIVDENVRTRIDVPMPDLFRTYSAAEIDADRLRGTTPGDDFHRLPPVLHDVVVLSWFDAAAADIRVEGEGGERFDAVDSESLIARASLAVYAQESAPTVPSNPDHGQAWNQMFVHRDSGTTPDLTLAGDDLIPDGPPETNSLGLDVNELRSLVRLQSQVTSQAGCGGGGGSC